MELKANESVMFGSLRILPVIEEYGEDRGKFKLLISEIGSNDIIIKPISDNSLSIVSQPKSIL